MISNNLEENIKLMNDGGVLKSPFDKRHYKYVILENNIKLLIISDQSNMHKGEDSNDKELKSSNENDKELKSSNENDKESKSDAESDNDVKSCSENDNDVKSSIESDKEEEKSINKNMASISICVHNGSLSDPKDIEGLSHFLEHMLFMGSEKYPNVSEFTEYIGSNGGIYNAYTCYELTNYYFSIPKYNVKEAIDRFVQFFIKPLFKKETIEKERIAVDNEFQSARLVDEIRYLYLIQTLSDKNYSFNKFCNGNLISLKENIEKNNMNLRDELIKHYNKYYVSSNMTAVIYAPFSVEEIESLIIPYLNLIPLKSEFKKLNNKLYKWNNIFNNFNKLYKINSIKNVDVIWFSWVLPPILTLYKYKPVEFISYIIGYEGNGSLYSYLKNNNFIFNLTTFTSPGNNNSCKDFTLFHITIELSEEGNKNLSHIYHAVFYYINLLNECNDMKYLYDDISSNGLLQFLFSHHDDPCNITSNISNNMNIFDPIHYLLGSHVYLEYDEMLIKQYIKLLNYTNVNIIYGSRKHNLINPQIEPWFNIEYTVHDIENIILTNSDTKYNFSSMYLPKKNIFMPDNLNVVPQSLDMLSNETIPKIIYENEKCSLYYLYDNIFQLPKCTFSFLIKFKNGLENNKYLLNILCDTFVYVNKEIIYEAEMAGLNFSIETLGNGDLVFLFNGCENKLQELIEYIIKKFITFKVNEKEFNYIKEKKLIKIFDRLKKQRNHMKELILKCLTKNITTQIDELKLLQNLTFNEFQKFNDKFQTYQIYIKFLVIGCISTNKCINILQDITNFIQNPSLDKSEFSHILYTKLPIDNLLYIENSYELSDKLYTVVNIYQITNKLQLNIITYFIFLVNLMDTMVFEVLRDEEQLGYDVHAQLLFHENIPSLYIYIESDITKYNQPNYIDSKIEHFLVQFYQYLQNLKHNHLNQKICSFIEMKSEVDSNLEEMSSRYMKEIVNEKMIFNRKELICTYAKSIRKEILIEIMDKYIMNERKKLRIEIIGKNNDNNFNICNWWNNNDKLINNETKMVMKIDELKDSFYLYE